MNYSSSANIEAPMTGQGGAELGGQGGHLSPHVLVIYLVNFGNFWKLIFRYLLSPSHKKFASAHPACKEGKTGGLEKCDQDLKIFLSALLG